MIETCWFYQCPNPECNCVGITNDVVLGRRCPDGVVKCPRCSQHMERIREAVPGEYDPQGQEELAKWATAFKVTFIPPWEADRYLSGQPVGETSSLTEEDAAVILSISVKDVRQLVDKGKLRSIRLTKRKQVFTRALIDQFLRNESGLNKTAPSDHSNPRLLGPKNNPISLEESRSLLKSLREDMSPLNTDERPIQISRRR